MAKKKKQNNNFGSKVELGKKENSTFELTITTPWEKIKDLYSKTLKEMAKNIEAEGFRKGKVPADMAEEKIGKQRIFSQVIQNYVPQVYTQAVQDKKLKPVASPRVTPIKIAKDNDWIIKITSCEFPEVDLGNYKKAIKKAKKKSELWTPDKGEPKEKKEESYNQKLNKAMDAVLKEAKVELPEFLVKNETDRALANFMDQLDKMDMNLEDYLSSKNMSGEDLRKRHRKQTERTLKLEFILQEIIKQEDIKVKKEEIDKTIENAGDEKTQERLNTPMERAYLSSILAKRKAIDFLLSL